MRMSGMVHVTVGYRSVVDYAYEKDAVSLLVCPLTVYSVDGWLNDRSTC